MARPIRPNTTDAEPSAEQEFPRRKSSESGSAKGYSVEARLAEGTDPTEVMGKMLTGKWQVLRFPETSDSHGIPPRSPYEIWLGRWDLLSYPAAQALRWSLYAHLDAAQFGLQAGRLPLLPTSLETRIIEHQVTYETTCTPVGEHEAVVQSTGTAVRPPHRPS